MNKRIGFIGLGNMGKWMALNLLKRGYEVVVYDLREDAVAFLTKHDALPSKSPDDLASRSDLILLSLPNSDIVEKVVLGQNGIVKGCRNGQIVVDCGTSDYRWTERFAMSLKKHKIRFADAPVTGLETRAMNGTLTIMFGGDHELLAECMPVLETIGKDVIHMGSVGSGQLAKMVNNVLYNTNMAALAEMLPMAIKLGLNPNNLTRVINKGSGRSHASEYFLPNILENHFYDGYPLGSAYKDMQNIITASVENRIPLPVVSSAVSTYQTALRMGYSGEDKGAMIKVFENILGVVFRKRDEQDER